MLFVCLVVKLWILEHTWMSVCAWATKPHTNYTFNCERREKRIQQQKRTQHSTLNGMKQQIMRTIVWVYIWMCEWKCVCVWNEVKWTRAWTHSYSAMCVRSFALYSVNVFVHVRFSVYYGLIRVCLHFNCTANCVIQLTLFSYSIYTSIRLYDGISLRFFFSFLFCLKFRYFIACYMHIIQ